MKPHPRNDSFLQRDVDRDREEAIVFLASIISKKNKKRIRAEIEANKDFEARHHFSLGMNVRNALRSGGFSHLPETLDFIWFSRLKEAVNLQEEKIVRARVCDMSRTSLLTVHSIKEAYNSTVSHPKKGKEFRNTLARYT